MQRNERMKVFYGIPGHNSSVYVYRFAMKVFIEVLAILQIIFVSIEGHVESTEWEVFKHQLNKGEQYKLINQKTKNEEDTLKLSEVTEQRRLRDVSFDEQSETGLKQEHIRIKRQGSEAQREAKEKKREDNEKKREAKEKKREDNEKKRETKLKAWETKMKKFEDAEKKREANEKKREANEKKRG